MSILDGVGVFSIGSCFCVCLDCTVCSLKVQLCVGMFVFLDGVNDFLDELLRIIPVHLAKFTRGHKDLFDVSAVVLM